MDFSGLLILAALWFLLNLLGRRRQPGSPQPGRQPPRQPPETRRLPGAPDATQQEGSRLERVLREFERALEDADPGRRASTEPRAGAEEIEEWESLEREPQVVSLELDVPRPERPAYAQDDEAELIVARRINAAAKRDRAISKRDHMEFDQRIRQEAADKTAGPAYTTQQLRDAVVWREILGPPVSLRDER